MYVCMYVCMHNIAYESEPQYNTCQQLTSCRAILLNLPFQMLLLFYSKALHLHFKTAYLMLSK